MIRLELNFPVKRSNKYSEMITALRGASELVDFKAFKTIKDIMSFAALLGIHINQEVDLTPGEKYDDIGVAEYDKDETNVKIIAAVALYKKGTTDILKIENEKEMVSIFERYANGGLAKMYEHYLRNPTNIYLVIQDIVALELISENYGIEEQFSDENYIGKF